MLELGRELSSEYAGWLAQTEQYSELRRFLDAEASALAPVVALRGRPTDDFLFATLKLQVRADVGKHLPPRSKRPAALDSCALTLSCGWL